MGRTDASRAQVDSYMPWPGTKGRHSRIGRQILRRLQSPTELTLDSSLAKIQPGLNVPVNAILVTAVFNICFGLLYLGPTVAFNAYVASCTIFLNLSYALPVVLLLIRGRKILEPHQPIAFTLGNVWGPIANWVGVLFVGVTTVFFCFPASLPTSSSTMNYVSVVLGIFVIVLTGWWFFNHHRYEGPKFDLILGLEHNERTSGHSGDVERISHNIGHGTKGSVEE